MTSSDSNDRLLFDHHTIRGIIGGIALLLPWIARMCAAEKLPSISWSYHTASRDIFVGCLFVIGAFLISYKGHQPKLEENEVGGFWRWATRFWKGAIRFRIWERKHEEDLIAWLGGVAAIVTALCPTTSCTGDNCPPDTLSTIHSISAIILFSTIVYFCLVAFRQRASAKIEKSGKAGRGPKARRKKIYSFCGWGIVVIMLCLVVGRFTEFEPIKNPTYWAELAALELFGFAWLVASQYLPFVTDETDRQKLF